MARSRGKSRGSELRLVEELADRLRSAGFLVLNPYEGRDGWEMLALHEDAPHGAPPETIPLIEDGEGRLWGELDLVRALIRQTRKRPGRRPRMQAASVDHDVLLHMPDAYSWIQVSGCQGHMGFDRVARTEWIRITRCMPDQNGEIVCTPLGDVPIEYFPDGEPGVSSAALAAILGTEPPWKGGVPAFMPSVESQE